MSLSNKKRNIFTTIGTYQSMDTKTSLPSMNDSYSSINNKKEPIPFLLELLKSVGGDSAVDEAVGGVINDIIDETNENVSDSLGNQLTKPESDVQLGDTEFASEGITIPVKDIDVNGKFFEETDGEVGSLLYGDDDCFDKKAREAIENEGTPSQYNGMDITYDSNSESFIFKPSVVGAITLGSFINNYLSTTSIINKKELMSSTLDEIFGTVSHKRNLTENTIKKRGEITKIFENLIAGDETLELTPDDLSDIFNKSKQKANGVVKIKIGCCEVEHKLEMDELKDTIDSIMVSENRFEVSAALKKLVIDDDNNTPQNSMGFMERVINTFAVKLVEASIISPEVRMLMGVVSSVGNLGKAELGDVKEDIKKMKICVMCNKKLIMNLILGFLFTLATIYLIKLLKPVISKITKERIMNNLNQMKSLLSFKT